MGAAQGWQLLDAEIGAWLTFDPPMAISTRRSAFPSVTRVAALSILLLGAPACQKPSSDNIQLWKTTEKGPDKLRAALADSAVIPKLRAEAAAALVDIGRADDADAEIARIPTDERVAIAQNLIPLYEVAIKDPSPERAVAARDALFSVRGVVGPEDQKRIDGALLPSIEADLRSGRLRAGRHSIDKVLTAIGPDAGAMLVRVLAQVPPSYPLVADMLGRIGDDQTRAAGAEELIAYSKKAKFAPPALWKALGRIGGPVANKALEERAGSANRDDAVTAVRAMRERPDAALLPFALKVAADARADKLIRDEMFGVVESIGGDDARQGLLSIISADREELVRYRAFEVVLAVSKADGVIPALDAFPAGVAYKKVDVDDLLVKLIEKIGAPARPVLVQALGSPAPLTRMTAVMALEQIGRAADAPALQKIANDTTALKGFPAGETIGKEAMRVAEIVKKKA
jgi:hypothetical protein